MSECHPVKQVDSLERDTKPLLFRALRLAEVSMLAWNIAVALTLSVCLSVSVTSVSTNPHLFLLLLSVTP